jgi:hypothetical protein
MGEGWTLWWNALLANPPRRPTSASDVRTGPFDPPEFAGLQDWPDLQQIVQTRAREAYQWSTMRQQAALRAGLPSDMRANEVVSALEGEMGRPVHPFNLTLVILPVLDDEVRDVGPQRYIVPERVCLVPRWSRILHTLVRAVA